MLSIEKLSKSFGTKKILDAVSLTVHPGEIALFLGTSGVGKSTLLRVLVNLETAESGIIMLNGKPLRHDIHTVGMVFQQFNLFEHLNVEENITIALETVQHKTTQEASTIAQELLKKFGLDHKRTARIFELSGGQKQRLAIARTIALKPAVVCMDEPTSALDPHLAGYVAKNIQELAAQGYIVLVASHDVRLINNLSCSIYLMENGTIVEHAAAGRFNATPDQFPLIQKFIAGHVSSEG